MLRLRLVVRTLFRLRGLYIKFFLALLVILVVPFVTLFGAGNIHQQSVFDKQLGDLGRDRLYAHRVMVEGLLNQIQSLTIEFANNRLFQPQTLQLYDDPRKWETDIKNEFSYFNSSICCTDSMFLYYDYYESIQLMKEETGAVRRAPDLNEVNWVDFKTWMQTGQLWFTHDGSLMPDVFNLERSRDSPYITLIRPIPSVGSQLKGVVVVNLKPGALLNLPFKVKEGERIAAISPAKNYMFDLSVGRALPADELELMNANVSNRSIWSEEADSYYAELSSRSGWSYVYRIRTALIDQTTWIQYMWFGLTLVIVTAAAAYTVIIARRMYDPLHKLLDLLPASGGHTYETSGLVSYVHALLRKERNPDASWKPGGAELKKWILAQIMNQWLAERNAIAETAAERGIAFSDRGFFVCVLRIDEHRQFVSKYKPNDQTLFRYFIGKLSEELSANSIFETTAVDVNGRDVALVCNVKTDADAPPDQQRARMGRLAGEIREQIAYYLPLTVSVGIGDFREQLHDISESYHEALQSLDYRAFRGHQTLTANWLLRHENAMHTEVYTLRKRLEHDIGAMLTTFNTSSLPSKLAELQRAFELHDEYPLPFIRHTFWELAVYIMHKSQETDRRFLRDTDMSTLYGEFHKLESIGQFVEWSLRLVHRIVEAHTDGDARRRPPALQHMYQYISKNYDKDISLNGIADQLQMDPSYLSKLIKQDKGLSFIDFLTKLRLEKARELLADSPLSVNEVSLKVGYVNTQSFIRMFKKSEGVTPGRFRELHRRKTLDSDKVY